MLLDEQGCDVLQGDLDTDIHGVDINVMYIQRKDEKAISTAQRKEMQTAIAALYKSHQVEGKVIIEPGAISSPPLSPAVKPSSGNGNTPQRKLSLSSRDWTRGGTSLPFGADGVSAEALNIQMPPSIDVPAPAMSIRSPPGSPGSPP